MRYALISDVHSNLEALEAVLSDISKRHVDKIICLGDIVGYGASPRECINLVKKNCNAILLGNHDYAVGGGVSLEYFNDNARKAVEWTRKFIDEEDVNFLSSLPSILKEERTCFAHGTLHSPLEWGYILDEYQALLSFSEMYENNVCFIGHSHIPIAFQMDLHVEWMGFYHHLDILNDVKYIINVGSVGQPRDGISDSAYAIYDAEKFSVDLIRVNYDIKTAQKKIINAGLPKFLSERIGYGR
ncbi:MAG: Metallophosphoesterase [uncultured bacterium]|nr:MAG: Metallophosphoesterase [uncultured bacterium]